MALATLAGSFPAAAATEATRAVVKAIEAKDCAAAVRELNAALATSAPEALLLGGSMFEHGLCLKTNVERASRLYQRAADAGDATARSRMAGLYASPAAGPDKGAAVWWGLHAGLPLPAACVVSVDIRGDADRFAQALSRWPAAQLDSCNYVVGVLAVIDAEFVVKPDEEARDSVAVDFQPAAGKVAVGLGQPGQTYGRNPTPDQLRLLQSEPARQELVAQIDRVARDALARFPRPGAVDASWRIRLRAEGVRTQ